MFAREVRVRVTNVVDLLETANCSYSSCFFCSLWYKIGVHADSVVKMSENVIMLLRASKLIMC